MLGGLDYHSIAVAVKRTLSALAGILRGTDFTAKGDVLVGTNAALYAAKSVGSDGQALQADSSQSSGLVYLDNPSRPNLLINPNWQLDQINEGALYTVNAADVRGPDGLSGTAIGGGVFKLRTVVDPDHPSLKAVEITCTTADAAIGAADDYFIYEAIEGFEAAAFLYGEAGAKAGTIQFPFKSSVAGTYGVSVMNSAGNRRYVGSIVVPDAAEHDYSLSFTADTAGAWLFTNGVGMYLRICLAAGTNFQTAAPLAWAAGAEQTVAAQANFMSNIANIAYLKRAQFIPGALVQAYRPADIQKELAKAQRQYWKTYEQGVVPGTVTNVGAFRAKSHTDNVALFTIPFPVTMRAVPTTTTYSPGSGATGNVRNETTAADVASNFDVTYGSARLAHISGVGLAAANQNATVHGTFSTRLS